MENILCGEQVTELWRAYSQLYPQLAGLRIRYSLYRGRACPAFRQTTPAYRFNLLTGVGISQPPRVPNPAPIARVALDVPLPTLFDYAQPAGGGGEIGARVLVPFRKGNRLGVIVETAQASELPLEKLKPILEVRDDTPVLPREWLEFMRFLAGYYQRPLGETVMGSLPPRLKSVRPLPEDGNQAYRRTSAAPAPESLRNGRKRQLLEALGDAALSRQETLSLAGLSSQQGGSAWRELVNCGWLEQCVRPSGTRFVPPHVLTPGQAQAAQTLGAAMDRFRVFLLHGVTGSGKTEVYLSLIARTLEEGRQALVMVPEISLTPQLAARFQKAFPDTRVVLLHSGLQDGPRTAGWLAAARGEASIVLGTRLAVLAPLPRLGLVVVDEEHDTSFKQQDGMRYSGRDAAVYRARLARCPIVLGSATPSLESWFNASTGRYDLVSLPERASPGARLPTVISLDMRRETAQHGLATNLIAAIGARLARREQSLVFINRRGYAPVLACEACGWAAGCESCTARLVLHTVGRRLRCHHCGAEQVIPAACPVCGNPDLKALGRGTQRVEETLKALFPETRIVRIDRDSAQRRNELSETLEAVRAGHGDILVGTQLLAKGHDFPGLTLVGVLNADNALLSTDYRAAERLFATLSQVAGRAGRRATPGEVLIQTRYPEHPMFRALSRHDFAGFAESQLAERNAAGFPPYVHEAALRAEAPKLDIALSFLRQAAEMFQPPKEVTVFDPVPYVITRRAGYERARLLVQSTSRPALHGFLSQWHEPLSEMAPRALRWHLDVDPIEFD